LKAASLQFDGLNRIDCLSGESYTSAVTENIHVESSCPAHRKLHFTTVSGCPLARAGRLQNAILDAERGARIRRFNGSRRRSWHSRGLVLLFLLLTPLPNRAHSGSVQVPFHNVQSMILVDGKVNGNPAVFLLDTGANRTIVSTKSYGDTWFALQRLPHDHKGPGLVGYSVRRQADLALGGHTWYGQQVSVMNLNDLKQMLGMEFDGLLGQDILREFRSVRIDYRTHTIYLEND
jgi:hypothetical protein